MGAVLFCLFRFVCIAQIPRVHWQLGGEGGVGWVLVFSTGPVSFSSPGITMHKSQDTEGMRASHVVAEQVTGKHGWKGPSSLKWSLC